LFREKTSITKRIKEAIRPTPLRQRIVSSLFKIRVQTRKLEKKSYELQERDRSIYEKCVSALQSKNMSLAAIYASECSEIRKMAKIMLYSQLALEQVALRLETVQQFGDIAYTMKPVASIVSTIKSQLQNVLPEISLELAEVDESLQTVVLEVGEATEQSFDMSPSSQESQKILSEASMIAEQKMKERFPEMPSIPTSEARL